MDSLQRVIEFYQGLTPESLDHLDRIYTPDVHFKDPFNEVDGIEAVRRIFAHMFVQVDAPRFVITGRFVGEDGAMLLWQFHFRTRGMLGFGARTLMVKGCSHLRFAPDGRVNFHRDYWDVAEELYARLPLIGAPMRWLQKAGRAPG